MGDTKSIAIIIARGGSKRIPRKNIKEFLGKPIIEYSIKAALESGVFDEVMVSTDDEEIANIAKSAGASVPFMRNEATANDFATTDEVIDEVINSYNVKFDNLCCIYPTAPFITSEILKEAMTMLEDAESVLPVVAFSYPPQRSFVVNDGELRRKYPEHALTRSQDLETHYHDAGQFYACRVEAFMRNKTTDVDNMVPLVLDEMSAQDIDTLEDWELAQLKYKMRGGK